MATNAKPPLPSTLDHTKVVKKTLVMINQAHLKTAKVALFEAPKKHNRPHPPSSSPPSSPTASTFKYQQILSIAVTFVTLPVLRCLCSTTILELYSNHALLSWPWFTSKKLASVQVPLSAQWIEEHRHGKCAVRCEQTFCSETAIAANRYLSQQDFDTYIRPMTTTTNGDGAYARKISGSIAYGLRVDVSEDAYNQQEQVLSVNVVQDENNKSPPKFAEEEQELLLVQNDDQDGDEKEDKPKRRDETFRQQILKLRQRYAIEEDVCVPLFDRDIPDCLYKAMHDQTKQEIAHRNALILDRINHANVDVSEVVREHHIELMSCCSSSVWSLFTPRRKLRPLRSYISSVIGVGGDHGEVDADGAKCRIILQIQQCRNLPIRKPNNHNLLRLQQQQQQPQAPDLSTVGDIVQPFVEVSFMGTVLRTFTSFGANARWEQTLHIAFRPPGNHKYTPCNLQKISADVEINIYDEWRISSRRRPSEAQRTEKRFLGSIRIPFTTIYFNRSVEGTFKVELPLITLGYHRASLYHEQPTLLSLFATLDPPIWSESDESGGDRRTHTYCEWLRLNYAGDANGNGQDEDKHECADFIDYCIEWTHSIKAESAHAPPPQTGRRHRSVEIFAGNTRNEAQLVCRYLRSVEPPMQITPEIFIRFVACIPCKEDVHLIPGARDVWMGNADFMRLGAGDNEEHANLLACFFMWYDDQHPNSGWSTYMAVGKNIADGDNNCLYVVRRHAVLKANGGVLIQNVVLYDACNGLAFAMPEQVNHGAANMGDHENGGAGGAGGHVRVPLCNLTDISIVYNQTQIYANLQADAVHPSMSSFNWEFEHRQHWKPLFVSKGRHKRFESARFCLPCLQSARLEYVSLPPDYYKKRQNKLEYIIERQFDEWRADRPTKWNYAVSNALRDILQRLEPLSQTGGYTPVVNTDAQIFALHQIYSKIYGFPLHIKDNGSDNLMLERDDNNVCRMIFNTKVHENTDEEAEFARAVYIYPYTNKIASVWVYIASLSKH